MVDKSSPSSHNMVNHHKQDHLLTLESDEIIHFAALLNLPPRLLTAGQPSTLWLASQARLLATGDIPRRLLGSRSILARLSSATHRKLLAVLCPAHSSLNARLIHHVFLLVNDEITHNVQPLRRYLRHPERYNNNSSSSGSNKKTNSNKLNTASVTAVRGLMNRLAGIAALWLTPAAFARLHPGVEARCARMEGGCEACILAAVGGDGEMVRDLGAVVQGRTHARRKQGPVLAGLVGAWIGMLDEHGYGWWREESEALGRVVKRVRRAVWRRRSGRYGAEPSVSDSGGYTSGGYTDAAVSGDELSVSERWASRGAEAGKHASPSPPTSPGWQRPHQRDEVVEDILQTTVEFDVYLRKKQKAHQNDSSSSNKTTHTHQDYDVYLREKRERYQHDDSSSITIIDTHQPAVAAVHEGAEPDLDYLGPEGARKLHARSNWWYNKQGANIFDIEQQHPALRASVTGDEEMDPSVVAVAPLALSQVGVMSCAGEGESELYDPAQWTDVSVATHSSVTQAVKRGSWRWDDDGIRCITSPLFAHTVFSSSSVYSTDGTAAPHPSPIISPVRTTSGLWTHARAAEESFAAPWDSLFAMSVSGSSRNSPSSTDTNNTRLPRAALQTTTYRLDRLALEGETHGKGTAPERTVSLEQSVSAFRARDALNSGRHVLGAAHYLPRAPSPPRLVHQGLARQRPVLLAGNNEEREGAQVRRAVVRSRIMAIEEAERRTRRVY